MMETTQLVWIIAVTVLTLLNIVWQFDLQTRQRRLRERYDRLFSGAEGADLQMGLETLLDRLEGVQGRIAGVEEANRQLAAVLGHSVQGVGMVRFSAFQDTGGDQSFSLALTDGEGNGVVVSALYGRGATRLYAKPIQGWLSPKALSEEEEKALDQARQVIVGHD